MRGEFIYGENLVLGFDFNEGIDGGRLYDISDYQNHGDVEGSPTVELGAA